MMDGSDEIVILDDDDEPCEELSAWKCPQCTFENEATFLVCEMCNLERPSLQQPQPHAAAAPARPAALAARAPPKPARVSSAGRGWSCDVCTLVNDGHLDACEACGAPSSSAVSRGGCGGPSRVQRGGPSVPSTSQHGSARAAGTRKLPLVATPSDAANENDIYTLDCGCCLSLGAARATLRTAADALPSTLPALLRHFPCPAGSGKCAVQVTRRDLEAMVGAPTAANVDRAFYHAACAHKESSYDTFDLTGNDPFHEVAVQCADLAGAISNLHSAVTTAARDTGDITGTASEPRSSSKKRKKSRGGGVYDDHFDVVNRAASSNGRQQDRKGAGYGGGSNDDTAKRQKLQAAAAERQRDADEGTSIPLHHLRMALEEILRAEESINLSLKRISPLGWLPLGILGVLQGGPLAPCLRLLLCNDSLMDITARHDVYAEALQLLTALASRQELVPVLLHPADGDILALFDDIIKDNSGGKEEMKGRESKRAKRDGVSDGPGGSNMEGRKNEQDKRGKSLLSSDPAAATGASGLLQGLDRSCWKALKAFHLQCQLFMRSAEELAGQGSEEDIGTVGTVILVQETCVAVDEAVAAWKAAVALPETVAQGGDERAGPSSGMNGVGEGSRGDGQGPSAVQKQRYVDALQPFAFRMIDLVEGGDYYFRQQLGAKPQGDAAARLRRLTKEISTLAGQLPVDWDSSILVAVDNNRMDALRAVIFPPASTPYASGAFFFDILIPPDYPSTPPKVQFMTTGGGQIRFNPNLYDNGKVCLSLLGTWSGPSWQPGTSTLLQVLVSIQAMILGEENPYGNEPGFERTLHTASGKIASEQYNQTQRYNTVQYSMLPALRGQAPKGFEEPLKVHFMLKGEVIKTQVRDWKKKVGAAAAEAAEKSKNSGKKGGKGWPGMNFSWESITGGRGKTGEREMKEAVGAVVTAIDDLIRDHKEAAKIGK